MIVDLTPTVDGTGADRLLDMVPGRPADAFGDCLQSRDQRFRDIVKIITMDGFTRYAKAAAEHLDCARTVMDPFHVVHLDADKNRRVPPTRPDPDIGASGSQWRPALPYPSHDANP